MYLQRSIYCRTILVAVNKHVSPMPERVSRIFCLYIFERSFTAADEYWNSTEVARLKELACCSKKSLERCTAWLTSGTQTRNKRLKLGCVIPRATGRGYEFPKPGPRSFFTHICIFSPARVTGYLFPLELSGKLKLMCWSAYSERAYRCFCRQFRATWKSCYYQLTALPPTIFESRSPVPVSLAVKVICMQARYYNWERAR